MTKRASISSIPPDTIYHTALIVSCDRHHNTTAIDAYFTITKQESTELQREQGLQGIWEGNQQVALTADPWTENCLFSAGNAIRAGNAV